MRKWPTGEPCAGEPHARFGGRGGETLPYPYLEMARFIKLVMPAQAGIQDMLATSY